MWIVSIVYQEKEEDKPFVVVNKCSPMDSFWDILILYQKMRQKKNLYLPNRTIPLSFGTCVVNIMDIYGK
jgi:hypothetical protein